MSRPLTIVMYHYVRDVAGTAYPHLKARSVDDFRGQLQYIKAHFSPVTMQQVIEAVRSPDVALPERPILLTFDDGYIDHYETVFPLLSKEGIQGSFFPPARPILRGEVLDVNKLHFVLAKKANTGDIVAAIFAAIRAYRTQFNLEAAETYWTRLARADRLDSADVVFVKRMLQRELPENLRRDLLQQLFGEIVTPSERTFARSLYMSPEQIQELARAGMYIGSHGNAHYWMNRLSPAEQEAEIEAALVFLASLRCLEAAWVMCYPYGAWNASLLQLLERRNCVLGLTTEVAVADLDANPLTLPRLDTVDLPVSDA
jgi:peptidoglycan/xylan/chitin deacetylase (PgdA/CDA1 family)